MSHSENDIRCSKCKHPLKHAHFYQGLAYGVVCVKRVAEKRNGSQDLFKEQTADSRQQTEKFESEIIETPFVVVVDDWCVQRWEDYKAKYGLVEIKEN